MRERTYTIQNIKTPKQTDLLPEHIVREPVSKSIADVQTLFVPPTQCVKLFMLGMQEVIDFNKTPAISLGRFDSYYGVTNNQILDLTPYGALERGVSRRHCRLTLVNNQLVVTDLGSTNGTFINGSRLKPHTPHVLKKGEQISLGRLVIRVVFDAPM